uniref:CCHC-type domain-containing protein n=1 Tax=Tanacetum cinerariifolium TaxID=118510 RepID=A0A6L2MTX2_TANCI|nr:hypothetical protein [Tanacetum cinerariifolium]
MSTSGAHQQSLADAESETHPSMLERESYIPLASRFRHYLNRKRDTQKFFNHFIDVGLYVFKMIKPDPNQEERIKTKDDLMGDDLKQYKAEIEAMNLILISIPNDIYNFVDSRQTSNEIWLRAKKLAKTHDPLALIAHISSSSSRPPPAYYVTHPPYVVNYDDDYQGDTLQDDLEDPLTSVMMLLACVITQQILEMMVELQGGHTTFKNNLLRYYNCSEKGHYACNCPKLKVRDSTYFMEQILSNKHNDFLIADAAQMEEIKELSSNICMMVRIQLANIDSDDEPSYDSTFISEEKEGLHLVS